MLKKIREYIRQQGMIQPGDRVIVAVSGGADSVCLLSVLCALAPELSVSLRALHVHHGLRGVEADRDEAYVKELCERLNVPFTSVRRDVAGYAKEHKLSTEEAGRVLRYEALETAAACWDAEISDTSSCDGGVRELCPAWIAVAHHQEDNAETILHHLLRGSGLRGLSGILPVQGRRIRPLLEVSREEILRYLQEQGLNWCEDSTNQSEDYTRNRIRSQLLPQMREQVNVRAVENILRASRIFAQADDYLERQAGKIWGEAGLVQMLPDGTQIAEISLDAFRQQEEIIQTYLLRQMLDLAAPQQKDITARHFAQLTALAGGTVGNRLDLPGSVRAVTGYDTLRIEPKESRAESADIDGRILSMKCFSMEKGMEIPKNQYTKWFDYDKIKFELSVRSRQEGDYLMLSDGRKKTIARYMIDEKIPRDEREHIPLLAEGSHVLWVIGYRISEYYKITNNTKTILQVVFNGGESHGR